MIQQAIESISRRDSTSPKTILGVLLAMYGVLIAASAAVILGLAASDSDGLIPFVMGFDALITVGLGLTIIVIAWKDPSRLMLGQVTASEYASIRRLHLGDDKLGERRTEVIGANAVRDTAVQEDESPMRDQHQLRHALGKGNPTNRQAVEDEDG